MGRNLPIKVMPPRGEVKTCSSAAQRDAVALVQHEEIQMSVKSVYRKADASDAGEQKRPEGSANCYFLGSENLIF
jgi:hypothetical protein